MDNKITYAFYECTIKLKTGETITHVIVSSSSFHVDSIIDELYPESEIIFIKPLTN
jgi:type IV secretory pathway VirB9-like protein